ncbi:hypothetical protein ACHWQZ_G002948 [Mnemiopsis leidyi]
MFHYVKPEMHQWALKVHVPDASVSKTLTVSGESTVSEVTLKLVELLGSLKNWSKYALWCTDKKTWLIAPRATLNTYGLDAGNKVIFTTTSKKLSIQLPDRTQLDLEKADFSNTLFSVVCTICRDLRIRHPEELSLLRCAKEEDLKDARNVTARRTFRVRKANKPKPKKDTGASQNSVNTAGANANGEPLSPHGSVANVCQLTPDEIDHIDIKEGKTMDERAMMNAGWLDSSKSLMEQDVQEGDMLLLRFKYFAFLDLNKQRDEARISALYHQAIRSVLSEDVVPTESECLEFAALQFAVEQAVRNPPKLAPAIAPGKDDLDSALADLEVSLGANDPDLEKLNNTVLPNYNRELQANLKFKKPNKIFFFLAKPKMHKFTFRDTTMSFYKDSAGSGPPDFVQDLKDCSIVPEVDIRKGKYILHIKPPGGKEYLVLFGDKEEFCQWTAACRLASKGKPISDSTYDSEIDIVKTMANMQEHSQTLKLNRNKRAAVTSDEIKTEDFVSARVGRKHRPEQLANLILDAHNMLPRRDHTATELRLNYILKWERLMDFGISYFIVKFDKSKKEELLGISRTHMSKFDLAPPHELLKTWHWTSLQSWNVNWEIKKLTFNVDGDSHCFECNSSEIKIVHEYIGGYIFLTLRKESDTELDKEMFYKLTGGWQ